MDICSEAAYPRHHNCLIESIPRGSCRHGSRFGPFTPTSPAPALPAPSRPDPANPCTNSPPAPGRELQDGCTRQLTYQGRGGSHYNGVNGEGRASTYTNGVLLTITLEAARAALWIGRRQPARSGCWGTIPAVQRERLVSPDLYLLDSPAGAIHRRGKAELHLVASG